MISKPIFKVAPLSKAQGHHLLVLTHPKRGVPTELAKQVLPARFAKGHPAVSGERGAKLVLHGERTVIVMGVGPLAELTPQEAAEWGENAGHTLLKEHVESVQVVFPDDLSGRDVLVNFLKGLCFGNYHIEEFKSAKKDGRKALSEILLSGKGVSRFKPSDFQKIHAVVDGIAFARDIIESPSGVATPEGIVSRFRKAADKAVEIEVWDEKKIASKGMGLIQAVSKGSGVPPRFLITRVGKSKNKKTLFLVGKGVTFDTGGVNLKVGDWKSLIEMKKDMGGAAAVLGAMLAISRLKPGVNVVGVTPLTTNQIGSQAINPGDIFASFSGKTVEIQNTDAEGRLVLADALHYAVTEKADWIVDAATLTGACCVALSNHVTGEFTNNERFAKQVRAAAEASGEPTWPMPMGRRFGAELKSSQLADLSNMGKSRNGGATIGAKFLENFVAETPWVHLDIAGTVDLGEPASGGAQVYAAGRMVHTFARLAEELR